MKIEVPITSAQALKMGQAFFETERRAPLTQFDPQEKLNELGFWLSDLKAGEKPDSEWKIAGMMLYSQLSVFAGRSWDFIPLTYQFLDDACYQPDKATIKVWLTKDLLEARMNNSSKLLGFSLSSEGRYRVLEGFKK